MMKKIINPHNLTDDMMDDIISRVKILPINQNNEILLCKVNGIYHFIGGHIEQNETQVECLKRELNEETGIEDINELCSLLNLSDEDRENIIYCCNVYENNLRKVKKKTK